MYIEQQNLQIDQLKLQIQDLEKSLEMQEIKIKEERKTYNELLYEKQTEDASTNCPIYLENNRFDHKFEELNSLKTKLRFRLRRNMVSLNEIPSKLNLNELNFIKIQEGFTKHPFNLTLEESYLITMDLLSVEEPLDKNKHFEQDCELTFGVF